MGPLLRDIRSSAKVATLAAVFLLSFTLYSLYCIGTVNEVKVNGSLYQDIERSQNVVADVLPPPEYLVETVLTAYELLDADDSAQTTGLVAKAERLRTEYLDRHAYWERTLPPGPLRSALVDSSFLPAQRLLAALEDRFLPAIRERDKAAARSVLDRTMRPDYLRHREQIDAVVKLAKIRNAEAEAGADMAVRSRTYGQVVIGILLFAFLSFFSSYVIGEEKKAAEQARAAQAEEAILSRTGTRG
jgi:methyl-accepting chemotaxis protein